MLNFLVLTNEQLEALCYINVSRGKQSGNLVVRCRWPNTHKKRLGSWEEMVFTSCMRCQVLWRDIVFTKITWNSFSFSQAFVLSGKEPTDFHKVEMILENTWMHGWTPRTSSTVLLHGAFVLRLKSQQHVFLTRSQISHHWLKHLTKLLSFSEGDLSSICNYKLYKCLCCHSIQRTKWSQKPALNVTSFQWIQETPSTFCADFQAG